MGIGMSPFSQQGQPNQSPSWSDTMMSMEGNRSVRHPSSSYVLTFYHEPCSKFLFASVL